MAKICKINKSRRQGLQWKLWSHSFDISSSKAVKTTWQAVQQGNKAQCCVLIGIEAKRCDCSKMNYWYEITIFCSFEVSAACPKAAFVYFCQQRCHTPLAWNVCLFCLYSWPLFTVFFWEFRLFVCILYLFAPFFMLLAVEKLLRF